MDYILPLLLILLGVVNANLIRVALKTGVIQSRMAHISRAETVVGFWSALLFQVLISLLCFVAAGLKLFSLI